MSENGYKGVTQHSLYDNVKPGVDLYLKNIVNGVPKYILYCRGDEAFTSEKRANLIRRNVDVLFTPERSYKTSDRHPKTTFVYKPKNPEAKVKPEGEEDPEEKVNPEKKVNEIFHVTKDLSPDTSNSPAFGINLERTKHWMYNVIRLILHDEDALSRMLKATSDEYTYNHSVNLAMLGLRFGKHIALNSHSLNSLGIGMLLHDIGKHKIPLEIINKPDGLTEDEIKLLKKHPEEGVKFLAENEDIDKESLELIIQHHENYDGSGYPYGLAGNDIHIFGRISRIIDVYDAMTSNRSYEQAKRPFSVLAEMKEGMSNCFDKELLKEFIHFLGTMDPRKNKERRVDGKLYYNPKITGST